MKAIVLKNGEGRQHVALTDVPDPKRLYPSDVLVRVLSVGLDGTDREIIKEQYGVLPDGESEMIIGHESLGVVVEAGAKPGFAAGDVVTALVRRPCGDPACVSCRNGQQDFCETGTYTERGIQAAHGYLCEYYVEDSRYLVKVPAECAAYGVLIEPQSIVEKVWNQVLRIQKRLVWEPKAALILGSGPLGILTAATCRSLGLETHVWSKSPADSRNAELVRQCGAFFHEAGDGDGALTAFVAQSGKRFDMMWECSGYTPLVFEAMQLLANNGVLAVLGVTPGNRQITVPADVINQEIVLRNKCIIGSVNASRKDFETGIYRLRQIDRTYPGLLQQLQAERFTIEQVPDIDFGQLHIKAIVDLVPQSEWPGLINPDCRIEYGFSV